MYLNFYIQDEVDNKKKEFLLIDENYSEFIKPLLKGRNLNKFYTELENSNILFISWHFPLHKDNSIKGASEKAEILFKKNILQCIII